MFDDDVERALASLPPDFRAAVVLCDVEGLSYDEIADILGAKLGTVRSRIHRGRAMLRRALAHRAPEAGRVRYSGPGHGSGGRAVIGHLGHRVSALLDGQLPPEEAERAWAHVHALPLLPRRRRARGLGQDPARRAVGRRRTRRPTTSRARCSCGHSLADRAGPTSDRPRRVAMVLLGGSAAAVAVLGVVALGLGGPNAPAPDARRAAGANIGGSDGSRQLPARVPGLTLRPARALTRALGRSPPRVRMGG